MNALAPLMSSDEMDWQTPDEVLELVRLVDAIGLDPCTTRENPTAAWQWICPPDDGLETPWLDKGLVYVNPPYGRKLPRWVGKCAAEAGDGAEIIALIPARTDTSYWHRWVTRANAICFWAGRLRFKGAPASAPFPSALVYWGDRPLRFMCAFGDHGWVVRP